MLNLPSKYTNSYWIGSQNRSELNNIRPENKKKTGKWLIFLKLQDLDEKWIQIKQATEEGKLGYYSDVSTRKHDIKPMTRYRHPKKVIRVFTHSEDDFEDIVRVRNALKELGTEETIGYKTWSATNEGRYAHRGYKKICSHRM